MNKLIEMEGLIVLLSILLVYIALYYNNDNGNTSWMYSLLLLSITIIINWDNTISILGKKVVMLLPMLLVLLFTSYSSISIDNVILYFCLNIIFIHYNDISNDATSSTIATNTSTNTTSTNTVSTNTTSTNTASNNTTSNNTTSTNTIFKGIAVVLLIIMTMINDTSNACLYITIVTIIYYSKTLSLLSVFEQSLYMTILLLMLQYISNHNNTTSIINNNNDNDVFNERTCLVIVLIGLFCVLFCGVVITIIIRNTATDIVDNNTRNTKYKNNKNMLILITMFISITTMLIWMNKVLSISPLIWIVQFLLLDTNSNTNLSISIRYYDHIFLCFYWIIMILISIVITNRTATFIPQICVRKIFHFTAGILL